MIDIHSHILPEMDDGSTSFEESLAMLEMAVEAGTTDIVATPHSNQHYRFDPEAISEKIAKLSEAMNGRIRIHRGCDFHLHYENVEDAIRNPSKYTINHKGYLLVELAEFVLGKMVEGIIERLMQRGLTPIVTHPERNPMLMKQVKDLETWIEKGCLVQVTAGSLTGTFGRTAKQNADDLLRRRMVHFIASDAHDTKHRTTRLDAAYELVADREGKDCAERLFRTNPEAVLRGDLFDVPAPHYSRGHGPKRWYEFWR